MWLWSLDWDWEHTEVDRWEDNKTEEICIKWEDGDKKNCVKGRYDIASDIWRIFDF